MASPADDEDAQGHSHAPPRPHPSPPPPPPPPARQWHASPFPPSVPPPPHFPQFRALQTVINGTTWYHPASNFPPHSTDSHVLPPSPSRYGSLPHFIPVNFDSSARSNASSHRDPYTFLRTGSPSPNRGVALPYGAVPGYFPGYSHGDVQQDAVARYFLPGADNAYGMVPDYQYKEQHAYYSDMHYKEPHMSSSANVDGAMPIPVKPHSVLPSPLRGDGSMARALPGVGGYTSRHWFNASYGMPPHALRTSGKTFRQAVTWCGMTMPVTITSQAPAVVEWIQRQTGDLFGFDLEWKPNRLKGEDNLVSLLQICGPADCLIIQLLYTDMIPKLLKEFLSNARKQLGGVGIRQDVKKLERDHDLVCQGQVELGMLASEKLKRDDLQGKGLKKLVDQVLGMTLVKIKKITLSNWEKEYLDEKQIEYACIDAWAAFAILQKLMTL